MSRPAKRAKKTLLAAKRGLIRGTVSRRFEAELRCQPESRELHGFHLDRTVRRHPMYAVVAKRRGWLVIVCGLFFAPMHGWAQSAATGTIAGAGRDATGAVLPGVTVEAASPALIEK